MQKTIADIEKKMESLSEEDQNDIEKFMVELEQGSTDKCSMEALAKRANLPIADFCSLPHLPVLINQFRLDVINEYLSEMKDKFSAYLDEEEVAILIANIRKSINL